MPGPVRERQQAASLLPEIICSATVALILGLIIIIAKSSFENYKRMGDHF